MKNRYEYAVIKTWVNVALEKFTDYIDYELSIHCEEELLLEFKERGQLSSVIYKSSSGNYIDSVCLKHIKNEELLEYLFSITNNLLFCLYLTNRTGFQKVISSVCIEQLNHSALEFIGNNGANAEWHFGLAEEMRALVKTEIKNRGAYVESH